MVVTKGRAIFPRRADVSKQSAAVRSLLQNFCFYGYVYLVSLFIYLCLSLLLVIGVDTPQSTRKGDRTCEPPVRGSTSHSSSNHYPIRISLRQAAYN